ncbi:hypothetical protein HMPREF1544_09119 [Mucor circinelloides 1006PhL]|uniref:Uncharacterized protein n=1 Tax=Mucor circinelloides f. circinelloides (strain 1006PhL) TaxID=1220926 RepID=S2J240_MUCC1|nr:hypothetical protein HMPREF1544_09119 [Mucor circinelloides 1006PhL]
MKSTVFSTAIFLLVITAFLIESSNAFSHPLDMIVSSVDRHSRNVASFLVKRKSHSKSKKKSKSKSKSKKSSDCSKRSCPMKLKPCPKDCPQSCGYLNSPDPCCPLLGKPTCPDY